jgi:exodeoxyribonuclease V alpha subunit
MAFARPTPATVPPVEALAGTVERVTFHNPESGFAVLKVQTRGKRDLITVVGHAASVMGGLPRAG